MCTICACTEAVKNNFSSLIGKTTVKNYRQPMCKRLSFLLIATPFMNSVLATARTDIKRKKVKTHLQKE
jgi:hypothetical protein